MNVGQLNRRVTLLRRSLARDEGNDPIYEWEEFGHAWASIKTTSGMQAIKAGAEIPVVRASIRIRFRRDVAAGMRVQHGKDAYAVEAVLPDEESRSHVDLVARQLTPAEIGAPDGEG